MTFQPVKGFDYFYLIQGIQALEKAMRQNSRLGVDREAVQQANKCLQKTIDFIEYNMRELEIMGGNGDE